MKELTPEEIIKYFNDKFKEKIKDARIEKKSAGSKKKEFFNIWLKIDKSIFKEAVKHLCDIQFPHLAVISGNDLGENIELVYHFSIYYGGRLKEISVNVSVKIPKSDPKIESICDIIPGALITEREIQEMLGVKVENIPDNRRIFLPKNFPKDVYPWRKDEKGPQKLVRDIYE
ncbi:MAG TPA: NADH-quinone oxidoreductase subunit C [Thermoplasmata archaeon]|nr:NADH-quinone oxidoreductase subunit C [Thermoplasmata archaeon]